MGQSFLDPGHGAGIRARRAPVNLAPVNLAPACPFG
jgi:hypothetical protein